MPNKMRVWLFAALAVCNVFCAAAVQAQDKSFEGARSFASVRHPAIAVGDFDGDGVRDFAMAGIRGDAVTVSLGSADGKSAISRSFATGSVPVSLAIADLNGDGLSDLVVVNIDSNNVSVLLGNGDGSFQEQRIFDVGEAPASVAVGDFNGDGVPDLAISNIYSNKVFVLLGNGDGSFEKARPFGSGSYPYSTTLLRWASSTAMDRPIWP